MTNHGGKRQGAGAKTKYGEPTKLRAFRVPLTLNERIQSRADRDNLSWSEWLVKFLKSKVK